MTQDKRNATGFVDTISAEDMGKFPDSNIAESINRIPGILITREVTGEGINIQIRGLGSSFTKVLLNQAPVAVASTGRTDSQNTNREVDLDLLPTDLFTKLSVYKSPSAAMTVGGRGVVDMRGPPVRPSGMQGDQRPGRGQQRDRWGQPRFDPRQQHVAAHWHRRLRLGTRQDPHDGLRDDQLTSPNLSAAQDTGPVQRHGRATTIP